jgi:hypothetical protein
VIVDAGIGGDFDPVKPSIFIGVIKERYAVSSRTLNASWPFESVRALRATYPLGSTRPLEDVGDPILIRVKRDLIGEQVVCSNRRFNPIGEQVLVGVKREVEHTCRAYLPFRANRSSWPSGAGGAFYPLGTGGACLSSKPSRAHQIIGDPILIEIERG